MRPFRFGLSIIFSFLVFCLLHSSPVAAQSGDAGLGRLTDYLPATGRDDAWQYTNTGNGFYGAYQFDLQTWQSVGGTGLPSDAPPAEQDARAKALYARRGAQPWPVCGRFLQ